jgi:hypothetical protein
VATSTVQLSELSPEGLRLFVDGRQIYLTIDEFPWFRNAEINRLVRAERLFARHLATLKGGS